MFNLSFLAPWAPRLLSVLRIVTALLFLQHGLSKYLGWPVANQHLADYVTRAGAAGAIELVGGVLLVLGLFSRYAAFVVSGEMAFAYFLAHAPRGFMPQVNGGEGAILFCFIFLYIAAAGPGPWSLDARRQSG